MTRSELVNWLWRLGAMTCIAIAGVLWLVQMSIERRIVAGESIDIIAYSPDGSKIAVVSSEGQTIYIWDVASGEIQTRFELSKLALKCIAFSPDSRRLASTAHGMRVDHILPARIDILRTDAKPPHERTIFIEDGVAVGVDFADATSVEVILRRVLAKFDVETGVREGTVPLIKNTLDQLLITDSQHALAFGVTADYRRVSVIDLTQQKVLLDKPDPLPKVNSIDMSRDGKWLAVAGRGAGSGGRLRVWDVESDHELSCDSGIPELLGVRIFPDHSGLATIDFAEMLTVWTATPDGIRRRRQYKLDGWPSSMAISRDATHAAIVTSRSLSIWNLESGALERTLIEPGHLYSQRRIFRYSKFIFVVVGLGFFVWSIRDRLRLPR